MKFTDFELRLTPSYTFLPYEFEQLVDYGMSETEEFYFLFKKK